MLEFGHKSRAKVTRRRAARRADSSRLLESAKERGVEHQQRWSEVAATACAVWVGMTACSGATDSTSGTEAGRAGAPSAQAGATAAGAGGVSQAGAGGAAVAGQGGASGGALGTAGSGGSQSPGGGGAVSGGAAPTGGAGGGGGLEVGEGSSAGSIDSPCTLESLHLKVSGGATFERSAEPEDACGGEVTVDKDLSLTFFVNPPELENTLLVSAIGHGIEPGSTGLFTPGVFSLATVGAIWDTSLPDAEHPLACSADLTSFEMVPPSRWRVVGSLSCPSPLSGIGPVGATPLTIDDFKFSLVFDAAP